MIQIQVCMFVCNLLEETELGAPGNDSKWLSGYYRNNEQTTGHEICFSQTSLHFSPLSLKRNMQTLQGQHIN